MERNDERKATVNDEIVIGGDSADIPPATYEAKLVRIETKTSAEWGDFRAWDFELVNGATVGGGSSMYTGKKSKGGRWIAALLGRQPVEGERITEAIIGASCLVVVGLDKNDWPKVTDVLPPMIAAPSQKPGKAPQAAATPGVESPPAKTEILSELPF